MKIIHLISGGDVGGAKTHVLSLLDGLGKTQTVRLVCFTAGAFADDALAMGIDTLVLDSGVRNSIRILREMIQKERFDIVHCHGSRANMIGAILKRTINIPIVTTVHSDYRLDYLGRPFHRLTYGTINTVALRLFDYHIGVSDAMVQLLISRGFDPQKLFSIYNGVEFPPQKTALSREEYLSSIGVSFDEDTVVFGIAARLNPVKDIATLIRGFAKAAEKCPNIRLVIAGDGEERKNLEGLAKELCPEGSVTFAGWVRDTDSFYHAIDVNMLTSLSEGSPYALVEGARMRCATIATAVGGIPYMMESGVTGLLFQPRDVETLAAFMVRLVENPAFRRQLGENFYEKAEQVYSAEATVQHQLDIYRTILRQCAAKKEKRRGVVICGAYGKGNAGDEAILKAILRQLQHIDPDMPITVLSHNPRSTRLTHHVGAVYVFNPFSFLPVMRRTKLYLSGGGSLIQNQTSTRSLYYYLLSIRLARLTGNKVLMYGCGIGPVNGDGCRRLSARVIDKNVDAITLREDLSAEELKSMGVTKPSIYVTADPALLLAPGSDGAVDGFLLGNNIDPAGAYALFVLRDWPGFDGKKDAFVQAAKFARERCGLQPIFFALEPNRDLPPSREVARSLGFDCPMLPAPADEKLIIGMMKKMRVVVSMRLHALIFASSVAAPLVAVSYDPKVTGFMHYIGQKHCVYFEDVTAEKLCGLISGALSDPAEYSVEHLRALAAQNEEIARKLLEEAT